MSVGVYGRVTWAEKVKAILTLIPMPIVMLYRLLVSPFNNDRYKTWKRVMTDASFRYISSSLNVNQMQNIMGTTPEVYEKWARKNGVQTAIDEIGDDARLLWFGKKTNKVILYIHGGTYCLPMQDFAASFWKYSLEQINQAAGDDVGFVALNYSLIPTAHFPVQLKQAIAAIQHLLSTGIEASNIHIVGESAGGALILQLLSHILHPLPSLPSLPHSICFGGACVMSPWVSLKGDGGSFKENSDSDALPAHTWAYLGEQTLSVLPADVYSNYLGASGAPKDWFASVDQHVGRLLVTVGEKECLRDDVLVVSRVLQNYSDRPGFLTTIVQKNGVHNDQYLDFLSGEAKLGDLTPQVIHWLENGLSG